MTDQYAVFGNPIAHSKSPLIHTLFKEQTKQDLKYNTVLVEHGQFAIAAQQFFDAGGDGLNITVPFKLDAFEYANKQGTVDGAAIYAGAVNMLKKSDNGKIIGYNTDGVGLIRDLKNNYPLNDLVGQSVLILGAGGAVRGVLSEIVREGFGKIVIANRTSSTAIELAEKFNGLQSQIKIIGCGFDDIPKQPFDLVINGTSASLKGDLPPLPDKIVTSTSLCYDMMYGKEDTIFMDWAKKQGAKKENGLGMLVEQAAESFYIWRGVKPETKSVIEKIRKEL